MTSGPLHEATRLQVDWGRFAQTQNAQPAYQSSSMDAPAQQFAQPAPPSNSYSSPAAYSVDLAAQLDLLSGDSFDTEPASGPAARSQLRAVPSWEAGSMSSNSPWNRPQMEAGVSQEAMDRHAMLPMAPSSARLSRRESQVHNAPVFVCMIFWKASNASQDKWLAELVFC